MEGGSAEVKNSLQPSALPTSALDIWIVAPLVPNGGRRAMPRIGRGHVRQYHQLVSYSFDQRLVGASWKIGPPNSFGKQCVAGDQLILALQIKAAASRSMPRRMQDLDLIAAEPDHHPV